MNVSSIDILRVRLCSMYTKEKAKREKVRNDELVNHTHTHNNRLLDLVDEKREEKEKKISTRTID